MIRAGSLVENCTYIHGMKSGSEIFYDNDHIIQHNYVNGEALSVLNIGYDVVEESYKNGKLHGVKRIFKHKTTRRVVLSWNVNTLLDMNMVIIKNGVSMVN